jgi:hypothetical protein
MSNFFPLLARAVSRLAIDSRQGRQELYDHARKILVAQLNRRDPHPPASLIVHEQAALEMAIHRVEAESPLAHTQPPATHRSDVAYSMNPPITERNRDVAVQRSQPRIAPATSSGEWADQMRSRSVNRLPIGTETIDKLDGREDVQRMTDVANNRLFTETTSDDVEASVAKWQLNAPPVLTNMQHHDIGLQHKPTKARRKPAPPTENDTNIRWAPLSPKIIGIVLVGTLIAVLSVACIAVLPIYVPRLIWLSEHLIDNPTTLLVVIPIAAGLILLLSLPILLKRRKKSVTTFFSV